MVPIQIAIFKCPSKVQVIKSSSGSGGQGKRRWGVLVKVPGVPVGGGSAREDPQCQKRWGGGTHSWSLALAQLRPSLA